MLGRSFAHSRLSTPPLMMGISICSPERLSMMVMLSVTETPGRTARCVRFACCQDPVVPGEHTIPPWHPVRNGRVPGELPDGSQETPRSAGDNGCVPTATRAAVPAKVLVVDDDDNIRYLLHTATKHAGFEVSDAATGREALESIHSWEPDL